MKKSCIRRFLIVINICFLFFIANSIKAQKSTQTKRKISKIVIDAGHGGTDAGCGRNGVYEKNITLAVALKLGAMITQNFKDVKVIYTRIEDIYPSLVDRHEIANTEKADLFISIHVNSSPQKSTQANGTETWVLGLNRLDQKEGALADNAGNISEEKGMLDANDPMTQIMIAQYSQAYLSQSINLGAKIETEFANKGRISHGLKQKGLEVLAGCAMPGVLVEIGFINNPDEQLYMTSEEGQMQTATNIFNGIKAYKYEFEKSNTN